MAIILRASAEYKERRKLRSAGSYFESHHIIPKALGGADAAYNRALLTAKEHYVCHHLLAKIYPRGSVGYQKMTCAWWRMVTAKRPVPHRLSAIEYAKLRADASRAIGAFNSILQAGERNSQFGRRWYTNIDTGASASFSSQPGERWILGRELFKRTMSRPNLWSIFTRRPVTVKNGKILDSVYEVKTRASNKGRMAARAIWDEYHSGKWESLHNFCLESGIGISVVALTLRFKKHIPIYSRVCNNGKKFQPNVSMIHVYE